MRIGLDVGSTTLKCVVLDENNKIIYRDYTRHRSRVRKLTRKMLSDVLGLAPRGTSFSLSVAGSAGMGMAEEFAVPFVQEVYATNLAVKDRLPKTDVVIELGGEDAKILFLEGGRIEARMNGSCAGGTGAFLDQMATLMNVSVGEMDRLASGSERLYTIASRCGVFAKSDVQPLLNQGARKEDVAASIFAAVVNQTIAGLAQGRPIKGRVAYLGGPLSFLPELRVAFDRALHLTGACPEGGEYFVAYGAALNGAGEVSLEDLIEALERPGSENGYAACAPLFRDEADYQAFAARHEARGAKEIAAVEDYDGAVYIGIDAGSTTLKGVVIDEDGRLIETSYQPNNGDPVPAARAFLEAFYEKHPRALVRGAASTGYGEALMQAAFRLDGGVVETVAHFLAAKAFDSDVDFIIDIGGQDIKCFKIKNGAVDNIFLNEACSSGCGSFLQTFASAWGEDMRAFSMRGLFAKRPVDLGSRCTVFMNSSVKQAQKDGATPDNISAGLSISVVKNALYKVIRASSAEQLGEHIVVQGGTFLSDAVLRAFELEIGREVVRPQVAGLMGAYGAALYAKNRALGRSSILTRAQLNSFTRAVEHRVCSGCTNHCALTVNKFADSRVFLSGNKCEKPTGRKTPAGGYNLCEAKRRYLAEYRGVKGARGKVGLALGLNMYELLPFWHALFTSLGLEVVVSAPATRDMYLKGQHTIPSDTVCYPAKLMHGAIEELIDQGVDFIFYPAMSYNVNEFKGDNHYNCPVVAYYPEVLKANVPRLKDTPFFMEYIAIHEPKEFLKRFPRQIEPYVRDLSAREIRRAAENGYRALGDYMTRIRETGQAYLKAAREKGMPVIVLAGRPYHIDEEICHGIDRLAVDLGAAVITEDAVSDLVARVEARVLNQWTYHARMYAAAKFVADSNDAGLNLVQLVSFGCGVDAVTSDETREIIERAGRIYTLIKIDEIANLGAARIRLRSLLAATEERRREDEPKADRIHQGNEEGLHNSDPQYAAGSL